MLQVRESKAIKLAIAVLVMATLVSCREGEDSVDLVIELLKNNGYQIGERSMATVPFVWQRDGVGVDVNGEHVVIYQYDNEALRKTGAISVDEIVEAGTGFWDIPEGTPPEHIYYARGVILVFLGGHSQSAAIRELLKNNLRVKVVTGSGARREVAPDRP